MWAFDAGVYGQVLGVFDLIDSLSHCTRPDRWRHYQPSAMRGRFLSKKKKKKKKAQGKKKLNKKKKKKKKTKAQ